MRWPLVCARRQAGRIKPRCVRFQSGWCMSSNAASLQIQSSDGRRLATLGSSWSGQLERHHRLFRQSPGRPDNHGCGACIVTPLLPRHYWQRWRLARLPAFTSAREQTKQPVAYRREQPSRCLRGARSSVRLPSLSHLTGLCWPMLRRTRMARVRSMCGDWRRLRRRSSAGHLAPCIRSFRRMGNRSGSLPMAPCSEWASMQSPDSRLPASRPRSRRRLGTPGHDRGGHPGKGLHKVSSAGGVLAPIGPQVSATWPSFVADGSSILYTSFDPGRGMRGLAIVGIDGSGGRQIARLSDAAGDGAPVLGAGAEIQQATLLTQGYLVFGQDPGSVRVLPMDPRTFAATGTVKAVADPVERAAGAGGILRRLTERRARIRRNGQRPRTRLGDPRGRRGTSAR